MMTKKNPYLICRYRQLKRISEKAIAVECFDGSKAVLPVNFVRQNAVRDEIYIPLWLTKLNQNLQLSKKKEWL